MPSSFSDIEYELDEHSSATRRHLLRSLANLDRSRPKIHPYEKVAVAVGKRLEALETYVGSIIGHLRSKPGITFKEKEYVYKLSDVLNEISHRYGPVLRDAAFNCYVTDVKLPTRRPRVVEQDSSLLLDGARHLHWRILPPGKWTFANIRSHFLRLSKRWGKRRSDLSRLDFAKSLKPNGTWIGKDKFHGYVIFTFKWTQAALLDRPMKGNACYILRRNWRKLSHFSKLELLRNYPKAVVRVTHRNGWRKRVRVQLMRDHV
jgi:hypothetical protein